jgi:hypothetical protein
VRLAGRDPDAVIQAEQVRAGGREYDREDRQRDGGCRGLGAELKRAEPDDDTTSSRRVRSSRARLM